MNLIVEIQFGSHLYGTATPLSDLDLKGGVTGQTEQTVE